MNDDQKQEILNKIYDCFPKEITPIDFLDIMGSLILTIVDGFFKDKINRHKLVLDCINIFGRNLQYNYEKFMLESVTKSKNND